MSRSGVDAFIAANRSRGHLDVDQDGGPWRAGPMTLTLKAGFW